MPNPPQVLKFVLALTLGIGIGALGHSFWIRGYRARLLGAAETTPLSLIFVPDADFTEQAKRSEGMSATVRLRGVVDKNGKLQNVRPFPMLPYNVPESAAGSAEFPDITPAVINNKFVKELPYDLTGAAIRQAQGIQFIPRKIDGVAVSEPINLIVSFGFVRSPFAVGRGCDSIRVTIFDDHGFLWQGQTSVNRYDGCVMI